MLYIDIEKNEKETPRLHWLLWFEIVLGPLPFWHTNVQTLEALQYIV